MDDNKYRNCISNHKDNCQYMVLNKYNVPCCSLDNLVQVKYFGCRPSEVKNKLPASRNSNKRRQ